MSDVDWTWTLANSSDLSRLGEFTTISGRSISLALNSRESASFTVSLEDKLAPLISKVSTCILCERNGELVWSGPVWTTSKSGSSGTVQVGCVGWFETLNRWLLHTGEYPTNAHVMPGSPTTTSTTQTYNDWDQCSIAADVFQRGLADSNTFHAQTFVTLGVVPWDTQKRNITYQQYKPIGQIITELSQLEAGFDFRVDPARRTLDFYYGGLWPPLENRAIPFVVVQGGTPPDPFTVHGRGHVRPDVVFGYRTGPSNCSDFTESDDADAIENDVFAVGQFATGESFDPDGIAAYGMFQQQASLSDVVVTEILTAYATAESTVRANGTLIYGWDQLPYRPGTSTFEPFVDFDIGDFVGAQADHGALQIGLGGDGPQTTRIFAFTVNINEENVEQVKGFQTAFTTA